MKYLVSMAVGVLSALLIATSANAAVVCNEAGDCWRTKEKYDYPSGVNVQIYDDDWKWAMMKPTAFAGATPARAEATTGTVSGSSSRRKPFAKRRGQSRASLVLMS